MELPPDEIYSQDPQELVFQDQAPNATMATDHVVGGHCVSVNRSKLRFVTTVSLFTYLGYFRPNWNGMVEPSFSVMRYTYVEPGVRFFVFILKIHC